MPLVKRGWSGVDLFFVLSGFILMHAHQDEARVWREAALRRFFWSRFTRVYPVNFAVLTLIAMLVISSAGVRGVLAARGIGVFTAGSLVRTVLLVPEVESCVPVILGWIGLCVAAAAALHRAVEQPVYQLARRWGRRVPVGVGSN